MTKAIVDLCNAVLACDYVAEGTKAWARDLKRRADPYADLADAIFGVKR